MRMCACVRARVCARGVELFLVRCVVVVSVWFSWTLAVFSPSRSVRVEQLDDAADRLTAGGFKPAVTAR